MADSIIEGNPLYPNGPSNTLGNDPVGDENLKAAMGEMNLSPQEQALYKRHLKNLVGPGGVDNPDGTRSTLFQITAGIDDKVYALPTVWDGKILPPKDAIAKAKKEGLDKFPAYNSTEEAKERYQKMHSYMEKDTEKYLSFKRR